MKKIFFLVSILVATIFTVNGQVNSIDSTSTSKEKVFGISFCVIKPIPHWIHSTAISGIRTLSNYKNEYGKVRSIGLGTGVDARINKSLTLFFEGTSYYYKQEIAEKGEDVYSFSPMGGFINLPMGAKYKTNTSALRLGIKYTYTKNEKCQPWIGVAYGLNVWNIKYITWDEDKVYGKAKGITWRSSILAGIDFKLKDVATFTFFFDAISPVADYTIENLFGEGDYHQFDAMTFPTPRIGLSISSF